MIYLFKSTTAIYFTICIISFAGAVLAFVKRFFLNKIDMTFSSIILILCLWALCVFIAALVCELIATKKMNKILKMYTDCNMQEYINILNKLREKEISKKLKQYLLLNLSTGYLCMGNYDTAKQILDSVGDFPNNRIGASDKVGYYNNLFVYYLRLNDLLNAADALEKFRAALDNIKLDKTSRAVFLNSYIYKNFLLNIENGNYDGAEQAFTINFETERQELARVSAKYTLGRIFLHYNKSEEAKEAFQYAIHHGGDTYYVEKSKYYLTQIPE